MTSTQPVSLCLRYFPQGELLSSIGQGDLGWANLSCCWWTKVLLTSTSTYMVGIPRSTVVSANCLTGFQTQSECIVVSLKIKGPHVGMGSVCLKDIPHASGRCMRTWIQELLGPIGKYLRVRPNHFPHSSIGWHGDLYLHPTVSVWAGWLHRPMSFEEMTSWLFLYIPISLTTKQECTYSTY